MQQQESKKQVPLYLTLANTFFTEIIWGTVGFLILSLIGIILGAINYVGGPVTYPTWTLTIWFVVNVFLTICVVLYSLFFMGLADFIDEKNDLAGLEVFLILGAIASFVLGGILLGTKHFAWISLFSFLILLACLIVDVLFLRAWLTTAHQKSKQETHE